MMPNIVKFWAVVIAVVITAFFFWALQSPIKGVPLEAREHNFQPENHPDRKRGQNYYDTRVPPDPVHQDHSDDYQQQILDVILSQGISGVGLIFLSWFIWKMNGQAHQDRKDSENKLVELLAASNAAQLQSVEKLAKFGSELENMSREIERIRA